MEGKFIHVRILRFSPEEKRKRVDTFYVPYGPGMTVQTMLRYIYEHKDPTLAFRDYRCGRGVCNACSMKVNGKVARSCQRPVRAGEDVLLEPANDRVIKDLVVQLD